MTTLPVSPGNLISYCTENRSFQSRDTSTSCTRTAHPAPCAGGPCSALPPHPPQGPRRGGLCTRPSSPPAPASCLLRGFLMGRGCFSVSLPLSAGSFHQHSHNHKSLLRCKQPPKFSLSYFSKVRALLPLTAKPPDSSSPSHSGVTISTGLSSIQRSAHSGLAHTPPSPPDCSHPGPRDAWVT